jgi:hypothetical protein
VSHAALDFTLLFEMMRGSSGRPFLVEPSECRGFPRLASWLGRPLPRLRVEHPHDDVLEFRKVLLDDAPHDPIVDPAVLVAEQVPIAEISRQ